MTYKTTINLQTKKIDTDIHDLPLIFKNNDNVNSLKI